MKGLQIKEEFLDTTIAFNGNGLPLKFRKDLHVLAKLGLETGDSLILRVFKKVPTMEQIKEYEGELFLKEQGKTDTQTTAASAPPATTPNNDNKTDAKSKDDKEEGKPKDTSKPNK